MGKGFLGTPASIMLDVVVCSLVVVVPVLLYSLYLVKFRRRYRQHKIIQVLLSAVLFVVVLLFEVDMRMQGGFWALAKDSPYATTSFMHRLLAVHLCFSVSTVLIWVVTLGTALWRFSSPPLPSVFSPAHKVLGWVAVVDMIATVVTGLMVYYYGFWLSS